MAIRRDLVYNENGVEVHVGEAETVVNVDGKEAVRIDWNKGRERKVVNLVTNYMSALCETGAVSGYFDRFMAAGTAWYIPEEGENIFIDSPEDCARVLNEYFL